MDFSKSNKVTLKLAEEIDKYLIGYKFVSIPIIVNCCTIALKNIEIYNSNLLIEERGYGKSTLFNILLKSNPKKIIKLPTKIYAIDLAKKGSEYFNEKVIVHDDLIAMFEGLSQKSMEQVKFFFTSLLSDHKYEQLGNRVEANFNVMFGCAKQFYSIHRKGLMHSTFLDRIMQTTILGKSIEEKKTIVKFKKGRDIAKLKMPKIPLPLTIKKEVELNITKEEESELINISLELEQSYLMTAIRSYTYASNFMKANALLNKRKSTNKYDFEMFKKTLPFYLPQVKELNILHTINQNKRIDKPLSDEKLAWNLNISLSYLYKLKKIEK